MCYLPCAVCYVLLLLLLLLHARPPSEPEPRVPGLPGFAVQSKCPEHTASARYSERARRSVSSEMCVTGTGTGGRVYLSRAHGELPGHTTACARVLVQMPCRHPSISSVDAGCWHGARAQRRGGYKEVPGTSACLWMRRRTLRYAESSWVRARADGQLAGMLAISGQTGCSGPWVRISFGGWHSQPGRAHACWTRCSRVCRTNVT